MSNRTKNPNPADKTCQTIPKRQKKLENNKKRKWVEKKAGWHLLTIAAKVANGPTSVARSVQGRDLNVQPIFSTEKKHGESGNQSAQTSWRLNATNVELVPMILQHLQCVFNPGSFQSVGPENRCKQPRCRCAHHRP